MQDMSDDRSILIRFIDRVHTTTLGVERIKRNLGLKTEDVVSWCKEGIQSPKSVITRKGKNWYITIDDSVLTVNASSYTIITAHKVKSVRVQQ